MLVALITAPTLQDSRSQQDALLEFLGDDAVSPIMWVIYVAVRTPISVVVFSSRYVGKLADSVYDFVLCDNPMEEAMRRSR